MDDKLAEAIKRAIECDAMLYNKKSNCPDDQRDQELRWIFHLADIAPDGPAVECGARNGGSIACWSMAREGRGPVYGVDTKIRPDLLKNIERYNLKVELLNTSSEKAPAKIKGKVAFCFIDADHTEAGIRRDMAVWPDKVKPGGVLACHDYDVWKPTVGVKKVVDEWQAKAGWELLGQVGSLIAFRKPK